ncbi:hypothetical protein CGRA01v4_02733 [Colletotrichum graminicola]|nr:hypothetical protein CGRA01v4_02733 [Colletotrichum graminicola]
MSHASTRDFARIWTCTSPGCFLLCLFTCPRYPTVFISISLLSPGLPYWAESRDRHPPPCENEPQSIRFPDKSPDIVTHDHNGGYTLPVQIYYVLLPRCGGKFHSVVRPADCRSWR